MNFEREEIALHIFAKSNSDIHFRITFFFISASVKNFYSSIRRARKEGEIGRENIQN